MFRYNISMYLMILVGILSTFSVCWGNCNCDTNKKYVRSDNQQRAPYDISNSFSKLACGQQAFFYIPFSSIPRAAAKTRQIPDALMQPVSFDSQIQAIQEPQSEPAEIINNLE